MSIDERMDQQNIQPYNGIMKYYPALNSRTFVVVQQLSFCTFNAGGSGLILGQGTKIPHVMQHGQK